MRRVKRSSSSRTTSRRVEHHGHMSYACRAHAVHIRAHAVHTPCTSVRTPCIHRAHAVRMPCVHPSRLSIAPPPPDKARFRRGLACSHVGQNDEAKADLTAVARADPTNREARRLLEGVNTALKQHRRSRPLPLT